MRIFDRVAYKRAATTVSETSLEGRHLHSNCNRFPARRLHVEHSPHQIYLGFGRMVVHVGIKAVRGDVGRCNGENWLSPEKPQHVHGDDPGHKPVCLSIHVLNERRRHARTVMQEQGDKESVRVEQCLGSSLVTHQAIALSHLCTQVV